MEYALPLDVAVLLKGSGHRGPVTPTAISDTFTHMSIMLQDSTEEIKVVFGLWMMVTFPAISPFPSCPAQAGVRQPKPWTWGSAEPWELAGLA